MALKLNSDAQTVFFTKVFGADHAVVTKVAALTAAHATFEMSLYHLSMTLYGVESSLPLTASTTALMKHTVDGLIFGQNQILIENWVTELYVAAGSPGPKVPVLPSETILTVIGVLPNQAAPLPNKIVLIKAIREVSGLGLAQAKALAEQILEGNTTDVPVVGTVPMVAAEVLLAATGVQIQPWFAGPVAPKAPVVVKPTSAVIDLKDAQALGQKVHGTSQGSVYYTIAMTDALKVAARLYKGGSVSIRAEWTGQPTADLKKLSDAGFQVKATYGSIHFDAADVPMGRIVGAFLVGTGINWTQAVTNGADLVLTEKF